MSISEAQFYQAKVTLKNYHQAIKILQQCASRQAQIQKIKAYEKGLVNGIKQSQIKIQNGNVHKSLNFETSYLKKLANFSKDIFNKNLIGFEKANTVQELAKVYKSYLQ